MCSCRKVLGQRTSELAKMAGGAGDKDANADGERGDLGAVTFVEVGSGVVLLARAMVVRLSSVSTLVQLKLTTTTLGMKKWNQQTRREDDERKTKIPGHGPV